MRLKLIELPVKDGVGNLTYNYSVEGANGELIEGIAGVRANVGTDGERLLTIVVRNFSVETREILVPIPMEGNNSQ